MQKQRRVTDYIFAGWFVLILLVIVTSYINYNNIRVWSGLSELTDSTAFLHGPMVWFYTISLIRVNFRFSKKDVWHILPFILSTVYLFNPFSSGELVSDVGRISILILKMTILFCYGIAVLIQLKKHKQKIANYFSNTEKVKLNWLRLVIWSLIIVWFIGVISLLFQYLSVNTVPHYVNFITNLALSIFVLVIAYFGIQQRTIFSPDYNVEEGENDSNFTNKEIEASNNYSQISQAASIVSDKRYERLIEFMESDKPFLDDQLMIYNLASQMHIPPYNLSQLINKYSGKNFFDFINEYRVEEFKRSIMKHSHYQQTLLAIALDCGFNSKSSFNRVFKKMTGQTPSEFVKSVE